MDLVCRMARPRFVSRLVLVAELGVENRLATRPVFGDAVLQARSLEIPTGRRPLRWIVDTLPGRTAISQATTSVVEVAPGAPLHSLVVLRHVQVHFAAFPQRPNDLGPALGKPLVAGEGSCTLAGRILIRDPDGRVAADEMNGVEFADARGHAASPLHVRWIVAILAVRVAFEFVGDGKHEQVLPVTVSLDQRVDPQLLMAFVAPQPFAPRHSVTPENQLNVHAPGGRVVEHPVHLPEGGFVDHGVVRVVGRAPKWPIAIPHRHHADEVEPVRPAGRR